MGGPGGDAGIDVCEGCSDRGVIRVCWSAGGGGRSWGGHGVGRRCLGGGQEEMEEVDHGRQGIRDRRINMDGRY